jgi:hypothetical protein
METVELPCVDLSPIAVLLVCPECENLLLPPTSVCASGHTVCRDCRLAIDRCPTCYGTFLDHTRNIPIEEICKLVGNVCPYSENGCNCTLTAALLPGHVSRCVYRTLDCPLNKIPAYSCSWYGPLKSVISHFVKCHKQMVVSERNCFMSTALQSDMKIIIHKGEAFIYYKYLKDSEWFAIIQRAGCTADKFRSAFAIRSSQNKNERVHMRFPITNVQESIDNVFAEGRAMILDGDIVDNFVAGDELDMLVAVEEIK